MAEDKPRRRFISLGEMIALAALVVSAFGVWIAWTSSKQDGPTRIVEQRQAVALTLRGRPEDEGRALIIQPVESSHALDSLTLTVAGTAIEIGSDGRLDAGAVESALKSSDDRKGSHKLPVRIDARYIEAGSERRGGGPYTLSYQWQSGGLFGGRSLRLTRLSRG